jgi:hypothetical protein
MGFAKEGRNRGRGSALPLQIHLLLSAEKHMNKDQLGMRVIPSQDMRKIEIPFGFTRL